MTLAGSMQRLLAPVASLLALSGTCAAQAASGEIAGWRGDPRIWRAEGGELIGSTEGVDLRHNTFLIKEGDYADFVLTCEVLVEGDNNGGVQYRSEVVDDPAFRVQGYQCDVHENPPYMAMLYGEGAGGIVAQRGQFVRWHDGGRDVLGTIARPGPVDVHGWQQLRIVARGDLVWHELDGRLATALLDQRADAPQRGVIALQVHVGKPMVARYRNVEVQPLASPDDVEVPAALRVWMRKRGVAKEDAVRSVTPHWIWDAEQDDDDELFVRRSFTLDATPDKATLSVVCDNQCRIYVNGALVARDDSWESKTTVDVADELQQGENVVAVHAWNEGGAAGVAARLEWRVGGKVHELVTDDSWQLSEDDPDGWHAPGFDAAGWQAATSHGELGQAGLPWSGQLGADALGKNVDPHEPQLAEPAVDVGGPWAESHRVVQLLAVPRELGSWVSLCCDPKGRLYACSQTGGLYRVTPARDVDELSLIEPVPVGLGGAHGLLWWRDSLYAVVNGQDSGLYRMRDTDGDDMLDQLELLQALDGSGEHGPHSVEVAPDGEHLLVVCGNHTVPPELVSEDLPHEVHEDRLVARLEDPHKYWEGHSPRGGWVCECDADGGNWRLICSGFRNPYDICVLPDGRVWAYDADMEWDMGMPWYRPTRLLEVVPGVDYGWRIGSAKWPTDYPEPPLTLKDLGPGSPTGMDLWGDQVVALDWTFGTVYANGEAVLTGAPLPLCDAAVAPDGHAGYLVTGGRGLPTRVLAVLPERPYVTHTAATWADAEARPTLRERDDFQRRMRSVELRLATERASREQWPTIDPTDPDAAIAVLLAIARKGTSDDLPRVVRDLGRLSFAELDRDNRIGWLRVHALALMWLGEPDEAVRGAMVERLLPLFPNGDERIDQDLCELLVALDAPGLLDRAEPLLRELRPATPAPWAEVASRNDRYGRVIVRMLENPPPTGQLAIVQALAGVEGGWSVEQRRTVFRLLEAARDRSGGSSYDGFLIRMIDAHWAACSDEEKRALEFDFGRARADRQQFRSTPPKGPGRNWTLADVPELVEAGFEGRKRDAGRNLFWATGCAACHYFAGEGGFGGPDLTSLKNKFRAADVLEAIIEPSKSIADQYSGQVLTKKDGTALFGVVHKTFVGDHEVYEVIPAIEDAKPLRVPVGEVAKVEPSPMSPMPASLINRLSADEVRDLIAFLLDEGR